MQYIFTLLLLVVLLFSCKNEESVSDGSNKKSSSCDKEVVISESAYEASTDHYTIDSVFIVDDCLNITFSASGCSGSSWEVKLVDAGLIMESYPPQRNLKLSLKNEEMCEAYLTKSISFDVRELQTEGDKVMLNMQDFEGVLYEY